MPQTHSTATNSFVLRPTSVRRRTLVWPSVWNISQAKGEFVHTLLHSCYYILRWGETWTGFRQGTFSVAARSYQPCIRLPASYHRIREDGGEMSQFIGDMNVETRKTLLFAAILKMQSFCDRSNHFQTNILMVWKWFDHETHEKHLKIWSFFTRVNHFQIILRRNNSVTNIILIGAGGLVTVQIRDVSTSKLNLVWWNSMSALWPRCVLETPWHVLLAGPCIWTTETEIGTLVCKGTWMGTTYALHRTRLPVLSWIITELTDGMDHWTGGPVGFRIRSFLLRALKLAQTPGSPSNWAPAPDLRVN